MRVFLSLPAHFQSGRQLGKTAPGPSSAPIWIGKRIRIMAQSDEVGTSDSLAMAQIMAEAGGRRVRSRSSTGSRCTASAG